MNDHPPANHRDGTPRWVKVSGLVAILLVLLAAALHFKHLKHLIGGFGHHPPPASAVTPGQQP